MRRLATELHGRGESRLFSPKQASKPLEIADGSGRTQQVMYVYPSTPPGTAVHEIDFLRSGLMPASRLQLRTSE